MDSSELALVLAIIAAAGLVTLGKKVERIRRDVALLAEGDTEAVKMRHKVFSDADD